VGTTQKFLYTTLHTEGQKWQQINFSATNEEENQNKTMGYVA
jgi:hypothetical protein